MTEITTSEPIDSSRFAAPYGSLTASELIKMAIEGKPIPADRVLATFADPANWVQLYDSRSLQPEYKAKPCEWAFIGPVRPPFKLAQYAMKSANAAGELRLPDRDARKE